MHGYHGALTDKRSSRRKKKKNNISTHARRMQGGERSLTERAYVTASRRRGHFRESGDDRRARVNSARRGCFFCPLAGGRGAEYCCAAVFVTEAEKFAFA